MSITTVSAICILIILIVLVWDAYLYRDKVERNSISQIVIDAGKRCPFVPAILGFLIGLLFGHLWG